MAAQGTLQQAIQAIMAVGHTLNCVSDCACVCACEVLVPATTTLLAAGQSTDVSLKTGLEPQYDLYSAGPLDTALSVCFVLFAMLPCKSSFPLGGR